MGEQVVQAARDFSEALSETTQYQAWEQATWSLHQDQAAQSLAEKLQAGQRELEPLLMLGAASAEQRAELERLRSAYLALPRVIACVQAEADLRALCQAANTALSQAAGLDFAAICASGCCG
jgi:cell fate (sporulation/competence/biofilm development) regulator YlbF (YheA/YmcA/DUF963 family)